MTESLRLTGLQVGGVAYPLASGTLRRSATATGRTDWEVTAAASSRVHVGQGLLHQLDIEAGGQRYMGTAWCDNIADTGITQSHHFAGTGLLARLD